LLEAGVAIPGTGGTVDLADYGIRLTGGSGSIAMTTDDSAYFTCRPANSKTTQITMPDSSDVKNLGCILVYPKNSAKQQKIVDFPKVAVAGTPFSGATRDYATWEFAGTPIYDEDESALFTKTEIIASN
jgi:hypothetical protein